MITPYDCVTKEIIREEQFFSYDDDYRVYLSFKPSLVKNATILFYVNGYLKQAKEARINEYSNMFEIKKQEFEMLVIVIIKEYRYSIKVDSKTQ
jgi:hypothetical protein